MLFESLLPVVLLLLSAIVSMNRVSSSLTFLHRDPVTGMSLQCERCPPGTFLRVRCSTGKRSECAPCPNGSFTEFWNYVGRCLRCGVCGRNQVVKKECSASSDCQCECKPGYFYKKDYDMCVQHSECPSGQGVRTEGTPHSDTVCDNCPSGTFSDISSSHDNCKQHKNCSDAGLQLGLSGSTWHDSVCVNCGEAKDGADYLKEIIPAFFTHQKMNIKRLRRIFHKLKSDKGKVEGKNSELGYSEILSQINTWVSTTTADQIKQLPGILHQINANFPGDKLQEMLNQINTQRTVSCQAWNMREVDLNSV